VGPAADGQDRGCCGRQAASKKPSADGSGGIGEAAAFVGVDGRSEARADHQLSSGLVPAGLISSARRVGVDVLPEHGEVVTVEKLVHMARVNL